MNRFLRTTPTRRLLTVVIGTLAVIAAGAAIAIAAAGSGPIPAPKPLAQAIHDAVVARQVPGISADIQFTNHLLTSSELQGADPLLGGGAGRVWVAPGHGLRIELQGSNGGANIDANIVVTRKSWWAYVPSTNTVYEGEVAATGHEKRRSETLPTVAQIQSGLNRAMRHLGISRAAPTDVAGQPTYTVTVSPKSSGGLLGSVQLAWDALKGVPLRLAVYARGDSTPVLELAATGVTYGPVSSSLFSISPPSGAKVVKVASPANSAIEHDRRHGERGHRARVTGIAAVQSHLKFTLAAPDRLAGMSRQSVRLLDWGGKSAALVTYGRGLGGIAVIEQQATARTAGRLNLSQGSGEHARGITLPTVTINGTSAQELDTALGTVVRYTRSGVTYTVLGSVRPSVADAAARGL